MILEKEEYLRFCAHICWIVYEIGNGIGVIIWIVMIEIGGCGMVLVDVMKLYQFVVIGNHRS